MEIKVKRVINGAVIYMYSTIAIFIVGWLQPAYACVACIAMVIGIYMGIRCWKKDEECIRISKKTLLIALLFITFMCWHTGIGAFTGQAGDWHKHNAVLHDLIEKQWPVIYYTSYGESMLSYYIGFYLLPSLMGKITGSFRMAELTMFVLTVVGIYLVWMLMVALSKADKAQKQLLVLIILFFYGGMLALGQAVCGSLYPENFPYGSQEWMNPETVKIQYSSNWSLLKWVPGQTIVPWMATAMLLLRKQKIETYVMIGLPVVLYSGFAMVGLAVMMVALCVIEICCRRKEAIREMFSVSNLMLATVIGAILLLYFWGNITGDKPDYLTFHLLDYGKKKIFYFLFAFFMFAYYAVLIFKENKKNAVYWITVIALGIYPLFSMGAQNDFTMRASIPALFTSMILVIRYLFLDIKTDTTVKKTLLAAGLVVGMLYPFLNLRESIVKNDIGEVYRLDSYLSLEQYADPTLTEIPDDMKYNYYTYGMESDLFYQYLAK